MAFNDLVLAFMQIGGQFRIVIEIDEGPVILERIDNAKTLPDELARF